MYLPTYIGMLQVYTYYVLHNNVFCIPKNEIMLHRAEATILKILAYLPSTFVRTYLPTRPTTYPLLSRVYYIDLYNIHSTHVLHHCDWLDTYLCTWETKTASALTVAWSSSYIIRHCIVENYAKNTRQMAEKFMFT